MNEVSNHCPNWNSAPAGTLPRRNSTLTGTIPSDGTLRRHQFILGIWLIFLIHWSLSCFTYMVVWNLVHGPWTLEGSMKAYSPCIWNMWDLYKKLSHYNNSHIANKIKHKILFIRHMHMVVALVKMKSLTNHFHNPSLIWMWSSTMIIELTRLTL